MRYIQRYLLLLILSLASLLSSANSSAKKRWTVAFLGDSKTVYVDSLIESLQREIVNVVGGSSNIQFVDGDVMYNSHNIDLARRNYTELLNNSEVDIIISTGLVNNFLLSGESVFPKPVIVVGEFNEFGDRVSNQDVSGIPNLTFVVHPTHIVDEVEQFLEMTSVKSVGCVVESYMFDLFPIEEWIDEIFRDNGREYRLIDINKEGELDKEMANVDGVIFLSAGLSSVENIDRVIAQANKNKIPSYVVGDIAGTPTNALITSRGEEHRGQIIRRTALTVEALLQGDKLEKRPLYTDSKDEVLINMETALSIEFEFRYSQFSKGTIIGTPGGVIGSKKYSLQSVLSQVIYGNPSIKSGEIQLNIAEKDLQLAKSQYLPDLSASITGTLIDKGLGEAFDIDINPFSASGEAKIEQIIYSQEASSNIKIERELLAASEANLTAEKLNRLAESSSAFFSALIAKTNYTISFENLSVTQKNLTIANQNFEAGETGKSDLLRWESEVANAKQVMITAFYQRQQAFNELNRILNNPAGTKIDVTESLNSSTIPEQYNYRELLSLIDDKVLRGELLDNLVAYTIEISPELTEIDHNLNAIERSRKMYQRSRFTPTVAAQGSYTYSLTSSLSSDMPDGYYSGGVSLSLPIYNRNQRVLNKQKSEYQFEQLSYNKESQVRALEKNMGDIMSNLTSSISNIHFSNISSASAKESLELMQISYQNGAVSITSLIDAQKAYISAKQSAANANYNYLMFALQMERMLGHFYVMHSDIENRAFTAKLYNRMQLDIDEL